MSQATSKRRPVIYVHDAAIDEYMATVLLTTMPEVDLRGVIIVNADCIGGPAMQAAWQLQGFLGQQSLPLALSHARGINPFPWSYRGDCLLQGTVPALSGYATNPNWLWATPPPSPPVPPTACDAPAAPFPSGEELLGSLLSASLHRGETVDLLVTSPMTPVRTVLDASPDLERAIARIIWMGGALDGSKSGFSPVPDGVVSPFAEWNAWWDSPSVDWVFRHTTVPIVVVTLNVTQQAPLTQAFVSSLQTQGATYRYSALAAQSYGAIIKSEPYYDMWDTLAAAYLTRPDIFSAPSQRTLTMCSTGYSQGVFIETPNGRKVDALLTLTNPSAFYDYMLTQFKR